MKSFNDVVSNVMKGSTSKYSPKPVVEQLDASPNPLFENEAPRLIEIPATPIAESFPVVPQNSDEFVASKHHIEVNTRLRALQDHINATKAYLQNITPTSPQHKMHLDQVTMALDHAGLHGEHAVRHLSSANQCVS